MLLNIIVLSAYALLVILIGVMGLRKAKTFNDFFLGGGSVGPWMSAFSYGVAYFSAVMFIGFAGREGWNHGYSALWITFGNAFFGVFIVWRFFGWRIKQVAQKYNVATLSEYLEKRYSSSFFKLAATIVIFVFLIPYSAAVFMGLSYLFEVHFSVEYWQALAFMGFFTGIYIVLGGYKSMTIIDTVFGIIMTASVILLFVFTVNAGGGLPSITETLSEIHPKLVKPIGPMGFWPLFSIVFLTGIAPLAMPHLVQKFYAIRDKKAIRIGTIASTCFAVIISGVAFFIGSTSRVFIRPDINPDAFRDVENVIPYFDRLMPELLATVIPASLSIVVLVLILSASMSTLAALVLVSASSVTKDLFAGFINKNASDKTLTGMMRIMSAVFVILAVFIALIEFDVIVELLGVSWGALGSFFLGPFVWGLLTKKVNRFGALSSAFIALGVCFSLYFTGLNLPEGKTMMWYHTSPGAGTIGMMVSLVANPVFSFIGSILGFKSNEN